MTQKAKSLKPKAAKPKAAKPKATKPETAPATAPKPATAPSIRDLQRELSAKIRAAKNPLERLQLRRAYAATIKQARLQSVRNAYPVKAAA